MVEIIVLYRYNIKEILIINLEEKIMNIVVGGIIEKDGKYLLIQEAKKMCYGKWNFPAGRLEFKESLKQGAIREIKEETGCDVELNGVCYIANRILEDDLRIMVFFNAKLVNENIKYDKNEILDVKWIGSTNFWRSKLMKYLKQFLIILIISFIGEILKEILPLPIPASIYGMVILFVCLLTKVIKLEDVRETGKFLIEIMPVMFIPAGVGLMSSWNVLRPLILPVGIITVVTVFTVMAVSGRISQAIIRAGQKNEESAGTIDE